MKISSVGVLGSGQMGNGIAQVVASSGIKVTLVDVKMEFLERGITNIKNSLNKLASKQKISDIEVKEALSNISTSTEFQSISECDLIIEAIPEIPELKFKTFSELDEICKDETILGLAGVGDLYVSAAGGRNSKMGGFLGKGFTFKTAKKRFMPKETVEGEELAREITPFILKKIDKKKIPLMINLLKTIKENKKLKIKV